MITRERFPDDQRAVQLNLTDAGRELRTKAVGIHQSIADVMALKPAEFTALKDSLEHLSDNVAQRLA